MFFSLFFPGKKQKMSKTKIDESKGDLDQKPEEGTIPGSSSNPSDRPNPPRQRRVGRAKVSKSTRAELKLPVGRIHKILKKGYYAPRVGSAASVYMTAVLEYLTAEILELAGQAAKENKKIRISPRHLQLAIRYDEELNGILRKTLFTQSDFTRHVKTKLSPKKKYGHLRSKPLKVGKK